MARFFITGSSDGLGSLTARALIKKGHQVVLHARNAQRAKEAAKACPGAQTVIVGDLKSLSETKAIAEQVNDLGSFDCIIHNAGLYRGGPARNEEGIPAIVQVNSLAPYVLTALINKPKRLVYVSSGLHNSGDAKTSLSDLTWKKRGDAQWADFQAYSDSKLHNILLTNAVSRHWPNVQSNSLDPGWVPTKMGGSGASGDIDAAVRTYVYLAEGGNGDATGKHYFNSKERRVKGDALDKILQDQYMKDCEGLTGVQFPKL